MGLTRREIIKHAGAMGLLGAGGGLAGLARAASERIIA